MQLVRAASRAVSLALLLLSLHVHAQNSDYNQNLTLRFFQDGQDDTCDYGNSSGALTFTTDSIPVIDYCFDFADLFGGNVTRGFVNQTENLCNQWGEAGIHWQLENIDKFDRNANYSRVLYRQHVMNPSSDDYKPGHHADRKVTLYGGERCSELDPSNDKNLLNWYGYSCWSEEQGACGNFPYLINSFKILPGEDKDKDPGYTCWLHAELGAAGHGFSSSRAIMGAFASVSLAAWLAL